MNRRQFIGGLAIASFLRPKHCAASPFPVHFRRASPYETLRSEIFPSGEEKTAMEIEAALQGLIKSRSLPLAPEWLASLGEVHAARCYVLPDNLIRYEIESPGQYRVGYWKQKWRDGRLVELTPVRESLAKSAKPLFRDVTSEMFGACESFREQMARGIPYWRARLDSASGIDIYGNNGIAAGDIDNDGADEIYVCQPGGLPNRLYKLQDSRMVDITGKAGVGLLDDTSCALFLDLRNSGHQDLVVLRAAGPLLFLNRGDGTFALRPDAFQFQNRPEGSFTGMAAADYDRDGRVDLYVCTYTYFQSEDQYRYPIPYRDAQNGPRNFLLRNQLAADGSGVFTDVTESAGLSQNNNRFSFAPAWCDYNGDGWPDLYVANDFGRNNLYHNREGRFEDVAAEAGVEDMAPGMSASWFDYDGDGRPDLYVSNMWSDAGQRVAGLSGHTKGNSLYRNRGDGTFEDTGRNEDIEMGRWAWSSDAHDFDNDGTPEIFVTCGMLTGSEKPDLMSFFWRQVVAKSPMSVERSEAYENGWNAINQFIREGYNWDGNEPNVFLVRRNGRYQDFSGVSGLNAALDSRAFAVTDFDGDGNLDLFLKSRLGPQVKAFVNDSAGARKAIAIRLTGTKSNRDAIGARVSVDGIVKFVQAGSGFVSQHTKVLHFGSPQASRIEVLWPSGLRQEFHDLSPGFRYEIMEGSSELKKQPFAARAPLPPATPIACDNESRNHDTWLLEPVPLPDKRKGPGLLYVGEGEKPSLPADVVNLRDSPPEIAAGYAIFRRYLLDWRPPLVLPLAMLIDEESRVHKLYATVPDAAALASDLKLMRDDHRQRLALPFAGDYYAQPRRNYFKLGAAFYWAGYPQQALGYLEEVIRQTRENDKALNAIGQIHLEAGNPDAARPYLDKAIAANPRLGEAWNNLGGVESASGNLQKALKNYERAIELLPKAAYPLVNAGEMQARLGNTAAAEALFLRATKVDPTDVEALNQLGLLAAKQQQNAQAKDWFQKAIALKRDHAGAINNLGVLYLQMGQANDAIAAFEYGISVAPKDQDLYYESGTRLRNAGPPRQGA